MANRNSFILLFLSLCYISALSFTSLIEVSDLRTATHCMKSITDDIYLPVTFHSKFSDTPRYLGVDMIVNIHHLHYEGEGPVSASYHMELIEGKCESAIIISGVEYEYSKITVDVLFFSGYAKKPFTDLHFEILPDHKYGYKAFWDSNNILQIFLQFGFSRDIIPESKQVYPDEINNYLQDKMTNAGFICTIIENKGYVLKKKQISGMEKIPLYHSITLLYKYSDNERFESTYPAWPCNTDDKTTTNKPTFILSVTRKNPEISVTFNTLKKTARKYQTVLEGYKINKLRKPDILSKSEYIYLTETSWSKRNCITGETIWVRTDEQSKYDIQAYKIEEKEIKSFIVQSRIPLKKIIDCPATSEEHFPYIPNII